MRFTGIISAFILLFFFVFTLKYFGSIKEPNDAVNTLTYNLNDHLGRIEENLDIILKNI